MARCSHCGRVNRDGALFCQDCGQRLPPSMGSPTAPSGTPSGPEPVAMSSPMAAGPRGATCPACGSINPPGMNFCKMCGGALRAASVLGPSQGRPQAAPNVPMSGGNSAPGALPGSGATCTSCGRQTPPGYQFCQHCGARLGPMPMPTPGPLPGIPPAFAPTMAAQGSPVPVPTPPMPGAPPHVPARAPYGPSIPPGGYGGTPAFGAPAIGSVTAPAGGISRVTFGRLIAVSRSGQDGDVYPLRGELVDLGRSEGELTFEDPFLAPRHARLERRGAQVYLRALDAVNGVYLRLREPWTLEDGDVLLIGKEVLRFELVKPPERDPPLATQHGVLIFGSPARSPWGRLRQLTGAGIFRDVIHLVRPELTLGREDGELLFPDDEFMSRRHATLAGDGTNARVTDLGSSNGTFVRVRGERMLRPGDLFRAGDQLLRFEPG